MPAKERLESESTLGRLDDHLKFGRFLLEDLLRESHVAPVLCGLLENCEIRRADPNLYLAVIGEFSSGKSTFINSMLGDDILPSSSLMTTSYPIEFAPQSELTVKVDLETDTWSLPEDRGSMEQSLHQQGFKAAIPADALEALRMLTTNEQFQELINRLRVSWPHPTISDNVVVIDTPGLESTNQRHYQLTESVIAERADAFVVVLSALQPVPQGLADYLRAYLKDHLHRCIFLVTKMDQVDADERERVVRSAINRLEKVVGPPSTPNVNFCAFGPALQGERSETVSWKKKALEVQHQLTFQLQHDRAVIIAETLARLLEKLLAACNEELSSRATELTIRQQQLDAIRMRDVAVFVRELGLRSSPWLDSMRFQAHQDLGREVENARGELKSSFTTSINACTAISAVKTAVQSFGSRVETQMTKVSESMTRTMQSISNRNESELKKADASFSEEYSKVLSLGLSRPHNLDLRSNLPVARAVSSKGHTVSAVVSSPRVAALKTGAGMYVGAILGNVLIPGAGIFIGGAIGGLLGGRSPKRLAQAKSDTTAAVVREIDAVCDEVLKELSQQMDANINAERARAGTLASTLEREYGTPVRDRIAAAQAERDSLDSDRIKVAMYVKELDERIVQLSKLRSELIQHGGDPKEDRMSPRSRSPQRKVPAKSNAVNRSSRAKPASATRTTHECVIEPGHHFCESCGKASWATEG